MKSGQVNTIQKASNSFEAFLKCKSFYDRKIQVQPESTQPYVPTQPQVLGTSRENAVSYIPL